MKNKPLAPKRNHPRSAPALNLSAIDGLIQKKPESKGFSGWVKKHWIKGAVTAFVFLLAFGVMAKNGWLSRTDEASGKKTGWFGREIPQNASSTWNPFAAVATPTSLQLSKEYIYAGSRLLTVEDANANAIPPEDLAVWRPSDRTWRVVGQNSFQFGLSGDIPVQGDYDGDGKTDFSVVRPEPSPSPGSLTWYVSPSSGATISPVVGFGNLGDIPVVADYDGDGKSDIAVYRPSNYHWYIRRSTAPEPYVDVPFGALGDTPAPADYDGDGKADVALRRSATSTFLWKSSSNGQDYSLSFGAPGDVPVCADYDGDGKANFALKRNDDWIIMNATLSGTTTINWPYSGGTPVPNDYDGDGIVDIAVWKVVGGVGRATGMWYIRQSHNLPQLRSVSWGIANDIPVPVLYRR